MYIEQGYKGDIGLWKYLILPLGFIGLMVFNYMASLQISDPEAMMQGLIDKLGSNLVFILLLAPLAGGLLLVWVWTVLVHRQTITSLTTSRKKVDWKRIAFAFVLWGGVTAFLTLIDVYGNPDDYVLNFVPEKFIPLAVIAVILVPLQTSFEEYLFRGHMMQGLGIAFKNRWAPLLITSFLFGIMHIANPEVGKLGMSIMVFYIGTGLFLGMITLVDEGLELALGFHAANNLIGALLVTADWTAFQTNSIFKDVSEPVLGWDIFVPVLIIYPIIFMVFAKKYGWTNIWEKLTGRVLSRSEFMALEEQSKSS